MTKTAKSILRNLSNTIEWCVEPQLLSRATIDRQREQAALDQALKELEDLIRTEKLKLLDELDKSMPTAEQLTTEYGYHMPDKQYGYKLALHDIREVLNKMDAEL